jgi:hypothetical protein
MSYRFHPNSRAPGACRASRTGFPGPLPVALLLAAIICLPTAAAGQDTNYWTQRYGTRADLLGGAVVGSILDLSSSYYNPGALALMEDPSVLLSGRAFEYWSLSLRDSTGSRRLLKTDSFGPAPSIFTTLLPIGSERLAFTVLTRQDFDVRTETRSEGTVELDPGGPAAINTEVVVDQDMTELWIGATWSRPWQENLGFGITPYFIYRGQRTRIQSLASAVDTLGGVATATAVDDFRYTHYRLLLKIGMLWRRNESLNVGFNLTTPSLGLGFASGGKAHVNRTTANLDIDGDGEPDDIAINHTDDDLDARYESPLSIAAGLSYRFDRGTLYLTAEWFDGVQPYAVMKTANVPQVPPGLTLTQRLTQELRAVTNVGIGMEYRLSDQWHLYGSFATDFSAATENNTSNHSLSSWNLYHLTGGAAFTISGLDLTAGLGHSFGNEDAELLEDAILDLQVIDAGPIAGKVNYRAWRLIIGFAFSV